jgi:hypothetical protein
MGGCQGNAGRAAFMIKQSMGDAGKAVAIP